MVYEYADSYLLEFFAGSGLACNKKGLGILALTVALYAFIKKTRATPAEDLALARKRQKEIEQ